MQPRHFLLKPISTDLSQCLEIFRELGRKGYTREAAVRFALNPPFDIFVLKLKAIAIDPRRSRLRGDRESLPVDRGGPWRNACCKFVECFTQCKARIFQCVELLVEDLDHLAIGL